MQKDIKSYRVEYIVCVSLPREFRTYTLGQRMRQLTMQDPDPDGARGPEFQDCSSQEIRVAVHDDVVIGGVAAALSHCGERSRASWQQPSRNSALQSVTISKFRAEGSLQ